MINNTSGISVSLSSDGLTLAVGGLGDDSGVGATWIFVFDGSAYQQLGVKLVGSGSVGPYGSGQGKVFLFLFTSFRKNHTLNKYC